MADVGGVRITVPSATPATDPALEALLPSERDAAWAEFVCDKRAVKCVLCFGAVQAVAVWGAFVWAMSTV